MAIPDRHGAGELVAALCERQDRAQQILDLATAELRSALNLEAELELIGDDHEINDSAVASIEKHAQNEYGDGVNFWSGYSQTPCLKLVLWTGTIREAL